MPSPRRARRDAGRHALRLRDIGIVDTVDTECALAHHALILVELARPVRTRPRAQLAADADIGVHQHDAIFLTLVAGTGRTDRHTGGLFAMQAGTREMHGAAVRPLTRFVGVHTVEPHAIRMILV